MGSKTGINWTDSTWNPVTGCTPAGEGCKHCYAARLAKRLPVVHGVEYSSQSLTSTGTRPIPFSTVICHPERLNIPRRWKKPRVIMCPSMGDLFHEDVPGAFKWEVWKVWYDCPQHTFVVLTKRPEQMREDMKGLEPPENVVLGVSVSTQAEADRWIPTLLDTTANRRVVSFEPLVRPVDLRGALPCKDCCGNGEVYFDAIRRYACERCGGHEDAAGCGIEPGALDGVIVGGESGPGARPMHPDWVRSLRDQCEAAGVPFFFKQWGDGLKKESYPVRFCAGIAGWDSREKHGGRELDGREHNDLCWEVAR